MRRCFTGRRHCLLGYGALEPSCRFAFFAGAKNAWCAFRPVDSREYGQADLVDEAGAKKGAVRDTAAVDLQAPGVVDGFDTGHGGGLVHLEIIRTGSDRQPAWGQQRGRPNLRDSPGGFSDLPHVRTEDRGRQAQPGASRERNHVQQSVAREQPALALVEVAHVAGRMAAREQPLPLRQTRHQPALGQHVDARSEIDRPA